MKLLMIIISFYFVGCGSEVEAELLSARSKGEDPKLQLFGMTVSNVTSSSFSVVVNYGNDANRSSDGQLYYCNESNSPSCDPYADGSFIDLSRADNAFSGTVSGLTDPGDAYNILFIGIDTDGYLTDNEISTQILLLSL